MDAISTDLIITSLRTRADKSIGISASLPELGEKEIVALIGMTNQNLTAFFKPLDEAPHEIHTVAGELSRKTPSQRLRSILYLVFSRGVGIVEGETFEQFYARKIEKIIEHFKQQLE